MALRTGETLAGAHDSVSHGAKTGAFGVDASSVAEVMLPGAAFATDASYVQQGDDLLLIGEDGTVFVVRGYFLLDNPPDLVTPQGGRISPTLVDSFTPPESPGQYAQAGQLAQASEPIGQVKDLTGQAFAVRADGTRVTLAAGDPVYQGDMVETADGGAVNMVFVDKTTFALGSDARLALDEMVYNPATQQGQSAFSILKGVFVFTSGQIAQHDNTKMQVNTPVATIGIRGTKVAGEIKPAGEQSKFTVIDGEIAVATGAGTVVMGDQNATTTVTSFSAAPSAPVILSQAEVNQNYSSVSAVSGGLNNSGSQNQQGPGDGQSQQPGDGADGAEAGPAGEGEGTGGPEQQAEVEGEGEGGGEGEGEGAADAEGAGDGEGGEQQAGGAEGEPGEDQDGEGPDSEGGAQQTAEGEGGSAPDGPPQEDAAEGEGAGGEGGAGPERQSSEGGEAEPGDGGEGGAGPEGQSAEGGEVEAGDGGPRQAAEGPQPGDGRDGDGLSGGGGQADGGPGGEGPAQDGAGGDSFAGDAFGGGSILGGGGGDLLGGGGSFDGGPLGNGGFGATGDPLAGGGAFGGGLDGGGDFTGEPPPPPPPPPDDPQNDGPTDSGGTVTLDAPVEDDRSTETTAQTIFGGNNIDTLIGGSGADDISGFEGDDTLIGNAGDDTLFGGAGDDLVTGGAGNDFLIAGSGAGFDTYDGGAGLDTLSFSSTTLGITANTSLGVASGAEIDTDSFTGIENLIGGSGNDILDGDPGINTIIGGAGDDTLDGAGGIDSVFGGAGDDTIGFDTSTETLDGGAGIDKIRLFGSGQIADTSNLVAVSSIEEVDLSGTGSNTLSVSSALVTAMSGTGTLAALGDGDDVVETDSNWNLTGPFSLGTLTFDRFTDGGSTVISETSTFRSTATINFNAGASLTHNIVNLGSLTTSDGTYTNDGSIILGATGDIDMTGAKTLAGTGIFTNEQSLSLQDDTVAAFLDGGNGTLGLDGTVTVDGTLLIGSATVVDGSLSTVLTGSGTLVNQGTHNIDDGSAISIQQITNQGSLDFSTLTSTITSARIENDVGGVVNFGIGTTIDMAPGQFLVNSGVAQISSSILSFLDGTITNDGTIDVTAATSTLSVSNGAVTMAPGGVLIGAGTVDLASSVFEVGPGAGFTLGVAGTGPTLEMNNSNIGGAGALVNQSEIVIDGASAIAVATFTNSNGGTLDHADGTLAVTSAFANQSGASLVVDSTVTNSDIAFSNGFTNDGLIKFVGGNQGIISVGSGSSTLTNAASGTIDFLEGDGFLIGDLDNQGSIFITASPGAHFTPFASANATMANSGALSIGPSSGLNVGVSPGTTGVTDFTNTGTLAVFGTLTLSQTTLTQNGQLQIVSGGVINVVEDSKLDLLLDYTTVAGSTLNLGDGTNFGQLAGAGTLFNAGILSLDNGTLSGNVSENSGALFVTGATNVNNGELEFSGNSTIFLSAAGDKLANTGTIDVNGNSTLTVDTGTLENQAAGTINVFGTGTIATSTGGIFSDSGTTNFGLSPGSLTIDGDMIRGDSAYMLFELGGLTAGIGGFDQLTVTGALTAGGTLDVTEFGAFDVSAGDSFDIVNAGTLTGSFREIGGLEVGSGVVLDALQSTDGVTLTGRAVSHQGTADDDTLTGGAGGDVIVGEDGSDVIVGGGGADLLHGGAGDDVFIAGDSGFGRIDGGTGTDTVIFSGANLDLTTLRGDQLSNVEHFDLSGNGNNTLALDADIAFAATGGINPLTGAADSLLIDGDAGDAVAAQGSWTNTGSVTIGGNGYSVFESGENGARIFVDGDVSVNIV